MSVSLDLSNVALEHVHLCYLKLFLHADQLTNLVNRLQVFSFVEIWNITSIQNIVDILKHLLIDDLSINKEE